ncbi:MAG: hypothetical protein M3P39_01380, partial [Actinomycetota bacterium]|nr:hypothetical protein [Actinomycetota bacterium]
MGAPVQASIDNGEQAAGGAMAVAAGSDLGAAEKPLEVDRGRREEQLDLQLRGAAASRPVQGVLELQ